VSGIAERLNRIERRLDESAAMGLPSGLTEPDPGSSERWEAAQVWAHIAEFVAYWHQQARRVADDFAGEPVPFGRIKTDPDRLAAIETGRRRPLTEMADQARRAIGDLHEFADGLKAAERSAQGRHQTAGELNVEGIIERFVLDHLEEHLDQLDALGRPTAR
jgi:hypothetical protein